MNKRLVFIDGLRGVLALIVFNYHFCYTFCPEFIFGTPSSSPHFSLSQWAALTPLNFLFNPALAIHLFFVASGYAQTQHYFNSNDALSLKKAILKRYFRLAFPVLIVLMLVYVCHQFSWLQKNSFSSSKLTNAWFQNLLPNNLTLLQVVKHGFVDAFISNSHYYSVLWTMPIELRVSCLTLILLLFTHRLKNKTVVIATLLLYSFIAETSFYALGFVFGVILAFLNSAGFTNQFRKVKGIKYVLFFFGIYLGTYPFTTYVGSIGISIYQPLSFLESWYINPTYITAAVLLFSFLMLSSTAQHVLSTTLFSFLGKISFMIYLVHLLVIVVFSTKFHGYFLVQSDSTFYTVLFCYLLTSAIVIALSHFLYLFTEKPFLRFLNRKAKKITA